MSYQGRRNNSEFYGNEASPIDERALKKEQEQQSSAKALKTATKGAATVYGGPLAGKAVDLASKSKVGQQVLNKGGKALNKMPGMGHAAKKLDDAGLTDAADNAIDMFSNRPGSPKGMKPIIGKQPTIPEPEEEPTKQQQNTKQQEEKNSNISKDKTPTDSASETEETKETSEESSTSSTKGGLLNTKISIEQKIIIASIVGILAIILIIFIVIVTITSSISNFSDAFGISELAGLDTGGLTETKTSKEGTEFYKRVEKVKENFEEEGKNLDVLKVVAVYYVINVNNSKYDYDYFTTERIEEIADAMFLNDIYNEETFRNNLTDKIFKKYFPLKLKKTREKYTEDVFEYINDYYELIGKDGTACAASGTCVYNIKGFRIPGNGTFRKEMQVNNLMVRLMECGAPYGNGSYTTPIDQDLVPFEDYVAGVAYGEIGASRHMEAMKAQLVMARSFALARPTGMGNGAGKKLEEENGQWILQISSCVADQVFCNINEGCSFMGNGQQGGIVRSGKIPGAKSYRNPLAADSPLRTAAAETQGEVLVDSEGYIIQTSYNSTLQHKIFDLAEAGYNYKQILLEIYNNHVAMQAADIQKMSCNNGSGASCGMVSTGPYASWKQYEGPWINVPMGRSGKTIKQIGCLTTSVAILIAKSGVPTNIQGDFNPGTFVQYLNENGGIDSGGNFSWSGATKAAPTFVYAGSISVSGYNKNQKLNKIKELLNAGYYIAAEVKGKTGQHWVAIDAVQGDRVIMMDPGSSATDMWAQYNWSNTSRLGYYRAG